MARIKTHSFSKKVAKVETKLASKGKIAKRKAIALEKKGKKKLLAAEKIAKQKKAKTESYVRKHPWKSLGIAAGIGFVVAKIFGRRR